MTNIKQNKIKDFYGIVAELNSFWQKNGCSVIFPYFSEVGAGTFHPLTVFNSIGKDPISLAYTQGCSRPTDGRYAENPNRLQYYYQFQVLLNPSPDNVVELYLESLKSLGIDKSIHDIRFVEDDWQSPSLGAFGLGWEVWCDGMEITQFTYFQQVGGLTPKLAPVEITYGLERVAMYILGINSVYDLPWNKNTNLYYGDLNKRNEKEFSFYNFQYANIKNLFTQFAMAEEEANLLIEKKLVYPAYYMATKASNYFNLLDARGALGVKERAFYIQKIQALVKQCCEIYLDNE